MVHRVGILLVDVLFLGLLELKAILASAQEFVQRAEGL